VSTAKLLEALRAVLGDEAVSSDPDTLALVASDLWTTGELPAAVVRPADGAGVAAAVAVAVENDHALIPRGGGLSYTGGYAAPNRQTVCVDLTAMNRVLDIAPADLTLRVQSGATWRDVHEALRPLDLRLPFFGTFSGLAATVGGGLSHGALFFGSARYGSAADQVLGLEVVLADGRRLHTGREAVTASGRPLLRSYGPDLTGLFLHDGGSFGIKTEASFRLIQVPAAEGYASFAFDHLESTATALSSVARAGLVEEVYALDPATTAATATSAGSALRTALALLRRVGTNPGDAAGMLADLVRGGQRPIPPAAWSLHMVAAGHCRRTVSADLAAARRMVMALGGRRVAATIPRVARADLFATLDGVLGAQGERWTALNAKVAHSEVPSLLTGFDAVQSRYREAMDRHGVSITRLASAMGPLAFSFETVFHWRDAWLPLHRAALSPQRRAALAEPAGNPAARALVGELRNATLELFRARGATSNQIGRTYPFLEVLEPATAEILCGLKAQLDPRGLMNPGVLGFGSRRT
jgi:FAD/FMN-containing dehydrogenase